VKFHNDNRGQRQGQSGFSEPGNSPTPLGQPIFGLDIAIRDVVTSLKRCSLIRNAVLRKEKKRATRCFSASLPSVSQAPEKGLAPAAGVFDKDRPGTPKLKLPRYTFYILDRHINNDTAEPIHKVDAMVGYRCRSFGRAVSVQVWTPFACRPVADIIRLTFAMLRRLRTWTSVARLSLDLEFIISHITEYLSSHSSLFPFFERIPTIIPTPCLLPQPLP
jgi:hypothetical protein